MHHIEEWAQVTEVTNSHVSQREMQHNSNHNEVYEAAVHILSVGRLQLILYMFPIEYRRKNGVWKLAGHVFCRENEQLKEEVKMKSDLTSLESKVKDFKCVQNQKRKEIIDKQEDAVRLEEHIKQEFAKLHLFLQDKEQKLIQQLKDEEERILKEMEENLHCIKQEIISFNIEMSDRNLKLQSKVTEAATLKDMEEKFESAKSGEMARQETCGSNLELREQQPLCILTGNF
ncbi:E3 ubiquitin-protein ligase TRIM69-like [Protopterus annectens]|uniref:E3 ubiquitin-protein ligase TRIM69-like n=1 Tax=Protopterus annectens TaxID=7888 RepID=UPI001CFB27E8|nr:E3 ubiquitin-protein ligase TRIM69-like [Protopterus annectens]